MQESPGVELKKLLYTYREAAALLSLKIPAIQRLAAAGENRRKVEEMAGHWDSFIDRVIFGAESWKDFFKGMLREMLAAVLKFIGRMIIAWILGLEKMKDAWEALKKSLPGGGGGTNIGINVGIGLGGTPPTFPTLEAFARGGLVDDAFRAMQAIQSVDGRLLAMLHQGEAVLNRGAVRLMGAGRVEALNRAGGGSGRPEFSGGVRSFQGGGFVGQQPAERAGPVFEIKNYIAPMPGANVEQFAELITRKTIRAIRRLAGDQGFPRPF